MSDHTIRAYAEALEETAAAVARLGGIVETQVSDAISAIVRRDSPLAEAVIERDRKADAAQKDIERRAVRILALRHPVANDLREVMCAYKLAGELERVGDLAKSMSKRTLELNACEPLALSRGVERMGRIASELLKHALDSYTSRDARLARSVWMRDEELDVFYNSLFRELLTHMSEDPRLITPGAHLLFVAKNIERVGDHATNIAEIVHYLITGEDVLLDRPKADGFGRTV